LETKHASAHLYLCVYNIKRFDINALTTTTTFQLQLALLK